MIPFVDLKTQYNSIRTEIDDAIRTTIESSAFISGPAVKQFEEKFASLHDVKHAVGMGSGTDALHMAVRACGVQENDEIITVPNTWISTAFAGSYVGAKPVLIDIDPDTYQMDANRLEQAITSRTKAIIPVHMFGHPAPMNQIKEIAKHHNIKVIEDVAQAPLAEIDGDLAGTIGDIGCYSFYPSKNLGCYGDGGAVITNDDDIAEKLRILSDYGQSDRFDHQSIGYNSRLDTIQAAILLVKLKYLKEWTNQRRKLAATYQQRLQNMPIKLPSEAQNARAVYHLFVIQVENRDQCLAQLRDQGIMAQVHYPNPIHMQPCYKQLGYEKGDFPHSERISKMGLSLPFFPDMTEDQIGEVASALGTFLGINK
jgi:dTDP-4-amino-4,6-dideoxygalactose transaminase